MDIEKLQHDDNCRYWNDGEFCTCGAVEYEQLKTAKAALSELARYFTSGNDVPVERATILAKDFWRIVQPSGLTPNV